VNSFTDDDINAKAANKTQDGKAYVDQVNSVAQKASTSVIQVAQNFTSCILSNPFTGFLKCPLQVASSASDLAKGYATALSNLFQNGQSLITDIANSLGAAVKADLQNANDKFKNIEDNLKNCVQNATANSTAAEAPSE
jgi:uncharacterized phage infection (PIP) family protein YhgE